MQVIRVLKDTNLEVDPELRTVAIVHNTVTCDPTMATRFVFQGPEVGVLWQALGVANLKLYDNPEPEPEPKAESVPVVDVAWLE